MAFYEWYGEHRKVLQWIALIVILLLVGLIVMSIVKKSREHNNGDGDEDKQKQTSGGLASEVPDVVQGPMPADRYTFTTVPRGFHGNATQALPYGPKAPNHYVFETLGPKYKATMGACNVKAVASDRLNTTAPY